MASSMFISRQIGTVSELLPVWCGSVTTGIGFANVIASTVGFGWYRNDMSAISTGTCTSGTLGTYSVSSWVQAGSTGMLGWYNFGIPNGLFVSGRSAAIRISSTIMELNIFIELTKTDNQTYFSSQALSTNAIVNVNQILGSTPVTSAAGTLKTDLATIFGSAPVTTAAGIMAHTWDLGRTANLTSTVALAGTTISTNHLVALNSIFGSAPVTTGAGILSAGITGTQTYNITGNLSGSVGSVTGSVASVVGLTPALLDVSVSSRLATTGYTAPLSAADTRTAVGLSTASLDTRIDSLATSSTLANVKTKTDSLNFTVAGVVDSNITAVNSITVTGLGTSTTPWGP